MEGTSILIQRICSSSILKNLPNHKIYFNFLYISSDHLDNNDLVQIITVYRYLLALLLFIYHYNIVLPRLFRIMSKGWLVLPSIYLKTPCLIDSRANSGYLRSWKISRSFTENSYIFKNFAEIK